MFHSDPTGAWGTRPPAWLPVGHRPIRYVRRYDTWMATCAWCGTPFASSGRRVFHSDACRQAAYRARRLEPSDSRPPNRVAMGMTMVYECPGCKARYLGPTRRCPDCNLFCRRIGTGGPCPHCDEPVAHQDLRT